MTDSQSGRGISNLRPAGWIYPRARGKGRPDQETCEHDIKKFARGGVSVQAEGNLNNYYILTLNQDNSVAVLNPSVKLATSNLLALIPLGGNAKQWLFDEQRVYVTMPDDNRVAVVDIFSHTLEGYIKVGRGPAAIHLVPDSDYILVGNDGSGTVSAIDRSKRQMVKNIRVGSGPLAFAFDPARRLIFVVASGEGRITVIDAPGLQKIRTFSIAPGDIRFAYSPLNRALYVAYRVTGELIVLFHEDGREMKTLRLSPGIQQLKVTPDGRFLFVVSETEDSLEIIDTAVNQPVHRFKTWGRPYHVEFSRTFAYLRYKDSPNVGLIQLSALAGRKAPPFADIPMGLRGPGELADRTGASPIAILPQGGKALVVDPSDKVIYFYMESGMLAPSNSFKSYTAPPLGLLVYDHRLNESATAGHYHTTTRFAEGGMYDVYFLMASPRVATCFELKVEGAPGEKKETNPQRVFLSLLKDGVFCAGDISRVQFKLLSAKTREPATNVRNVRVLSFLQNGTWQARRWAKPIGQGLFMVEFVFPRAGKYHILVESPELGIRFDDAGYAFANVQHSRRQKTAPCVDG
ncbi:MAG: hypothetical protein ACE5G9_05400 [Nitrospinales bacterium]